MARTAYGSTAYLVSIKVELAKLHRCGCSSKNLHFQASSCINLWIMVVISAAHLGANFFGAFPPAGIPISFNLEILTNNNLIPSVFSSWFYNKIYSSEF